MPYVSRAGTKLEHALKHFDLDVAGQTCADFGSNTGGFVDCLLQFGASKVYAVETGYGVLDWKLRNDPRVVIMERTNAMHIALPEKVDLISIDVSWTRLENIIPNALKNLKFDGQMIALLKPHYEANPKLLRKGRLPEDAMAEILVNVKTAVQKLGVEILNIIESPIVGEKGKNREYLLHLKRSDTV